MSGESYVVTAPYVTLKGRDQAGGMVVRGLYKGAVVAGDGLDPASLRHHLDAELVELMADAMPAVVEKPAEPEKTAEPVVKGKAAK